MKSALLNGAISIAVLAAGAALVYFLYSNAQNKQAEAAANASSAQYNNDQDQLLQQQEYSALLDGFNTADASTSAEDTTQPTISGSAASTAQNTTTTSPS